jgi:hypothetical protein
LKFGVVAAVAQVIHAVTVVHSPLVEQEETMLQKQLIQLRDANTVFVLVVLGHVVKHTLVVHHWAVSHILMDII